MAIKERKVAILVEDDYEDLELWYPYYRLKEAGFEPAIIGPGQKKVYHSKHGYEAKVDLDVSEAKAAMFEGLVIPGGFAPDRMRRHQAVVEFVRIMDREGKMIAAICHGPSVLISANVLQHRKATGFMSIKDDMTNAGARYIDEEVIIDGRMVTSRRPADLPAFMRAILELLG
ncbi:MAG TPA: type 1 glutamine amidotransferase domain-containing protein [Methanomassiliicoccales archaeon]|nr:type 1 glutamine amidotransferase domain-containing protein [Methanomassiliicoccales archaeon]